jgi:hypothetical protein
MTGKSIWQSIKLWATWVVTYTVANPFTYDCAVGVLAYLTAALGWFEPWLPACCIGYLLFRIWRLKRRLSVFLKSMP